jgi:hypothetical protein
MKRLVNLNNRATPDTYGCPDPALLWHVHYKMHIKTFVKCRSRVKTLQGLRANRVKLMAIILAASNPPSYFPEPSLEMLT